MNSQFSFQPRPMHASLAALLLVSATVWAADPQSAAPAAKANLKLLTWNIQMLPTSVSFASPDLQKKQELRAPWIIDYLNEQDYDIVVLEEVIDPKMTKLLKEGLSRKYPHIVAPPSTAGISGCTGGILFVSKIPLKYVAHIVYKNIAGIDRLAEKGCVLVEAERDGVRFQVAGTHLQAGHAAVRVKEFPEIYEGIIKPHRQEGVPQFLVGDMNVASDVDDEKTMFQSLLKTTEMQAFPLNDERPYTVDGMNSWSRPGKKGEHIDHVLLNPRGTGTTIVRQTVQRASRIHEGEKIDYADHYGVIAEILLRN